MTKKGNIASISLASTALSLLIVIRLQYCRPLRQSLVHFLWSFGHVPDVDNWGRAIIGYAYDYEQPIHYAKKISFYCESNLEIFYFLKI